MFVTVAHISADDAIAVYSAEAQDLQKPDDIILGFALNVIDDSAVPHDMEDRYEQSCQYTQKVNSIISFFPFFQIVSLQI